MVIDDIEKDGQSLAMASIDQPLQTVGTAVTILGRVREHTVVAPVACARKLADRHDLDRRDTQLAQVP